MIDEAVAKLDKERFERLDELERREAAIAESGGLAHATPGQMIEALENRGVTAILITLQPENGVLDFTNIVKMDVSISFTNDIGEREMETTIFTIATQFGKKYVK